MLSRLRRASHAKRDHVAHAELSWRFFRRPITVVAALRLTSSALTLWCQPLNAARSDTLCIACAALSAQSAACLAPREARATRRQLFHTRTRCARNIFLSAVMAVLFARCFCLASLSLSNPIALIHKLMAA